MTMIEPALTPDEWIAFTSELQRLREQGLDMSSSVYGDEVGWDTAGCAANIALNNAALPDSDPRKVAPETVRRLRAISEAIRNEHQNWDAKAFLAALADSLESYLPPEALT